MSSVGAPTNMQRPSHVGDPTWEIAERFFPRQGTWTEEQFFALENHLIEFVDGRLEFLPMPTELHQDIMLFFYRVLLALAKGKVSVSGVKVRIKDRDYREPDVVFMLAEHADKRSNQYWNGADLVVDVVSPGGESRDRDYGEKRAEYASAGIPEYWIADPERETVTVLTLKPDAGYVLHGEFKKGERASSLLLPGFGIDVSEALRGGQA